VFAQGPGEARRATPRTILDTLSTADDDVQHSMGADMDVASWLRSLGLERYEAAFRDNEITEKVLPNLTAEDLKELGVALGHRRTLLDAIAALRNDASVQTPPVAAAPARPSAATPTSAPVAETVGERRHVTVMFCDLVGSTSISAGLDAQDWRDLVGTYLDAATAAVTEMGGHVAKKLGDGLMALFGYPVAQENDAERAARAALSIQRALVEVNRKNAMSGKPPLNARIGIETGPVVVDAAGEIYGDAPNTAARVQVLAEPGTVVVTAHVQREIAGLFVAEERGAHDLKGVPEPVTLFQLIRASGGGRRARQGHLTPLVGREEEIAMLMRRWERARQGDGQLVLIVGEPGLGHVRFQSQACGLVRGTGARTRARKHQVWQGQFSPEAERDLLHIRPCGGCRGDASVSQAATSGRSGDAIRADARGKCLNVYFADAANNAVTITP
jgi:class 3 adenylate cyclase